MYLDPRIVHPELISLPPSGTVDTKNIRPRRTDEPSRILDLGQAAKDGPGSEARAVSFDEETASTHFRGPPGRAAAGNCSLQRRHSFRAEAEGMQLSEWATQQTPAAATALTKCVPEESLLPSPFTPKLTLRTTAALVRRSNKPPSLNP